MRIYDLEFSALTRTSSSTRYPTEVQGALRMMRQKAGVKDRDEIYEMLSSGNFMTDVTMN